MKLPPPELLTIDWPPNALESWDELIAQVIRAGEQGVQTDKYQEVLKQLKQCIRSGNLQGLAKILRSRIAGRALSGLWLEDKEYRIAALTQKILDLLVEFQGGKLGALALQNLITLYFREFDLLEQHGEGLPTHLEKLIKQQLEQRFKKHKVKAEEYRDVLRVLHFEAGWLLSQDGPRSLVMHAKQSKQELDQVFLEFELRGLDDGRYAEICRTHYYLEILQDLPVGKYHEVFAEILKPDVNRAPYIEGKRFGHKVLELLIDRAGSDPGEEWLNFILDLAGDPRITSGARSYRDWWQPLGKERIEQVRSWLHKEDLRLFLRALKQYSDESDDPGIQRMLPARTRFIEGMERLKLMRNTRLMLGNVAESAIKRILGKELKTNFIRLEGSNLSDKAVLYMDCGDFCLIQGSHNFKLWVFLKPPSEKIISYTTLSLSHSELTTGAARSYRIKYGQDAPYADITHFPTTWHNNFFEFLASHGIKIDIEPLMFPEDYRVYFERFGMPYVKPRKTELKPIEN